MEWNGMGWDRMGWDGMEWNGISQNRSELLNLVHAQGEEIIQGLEHKDAGIFWDYV